MPKANLRILAGHGRMLPWILVAVIVIRVTDGIAEWKPVSATAGEETRAADLNRAGGLPNAIDLYRRRTQSVQK